MAAESEAEASFLERLISSRNRDLSLFFPLILGVMGATRREGQEEQGSDQESGEGQTQERIVLINPFTQGMIVIDGGGRSFEALIREISESESGKTGLPPASKASIEAMPTVEIEGEEEECAICLEGMEIGGEAKEMPCKHRYHTNCIEKWLGIHGSCPVCRYKMPVEEEEKKGDEGNGRREGRAEREIWVRVSVGRSDRDSTPEGDRTEAD